MNKQIVFFSIAATIIFILVVLLVWVSRTSTIVQLADNNLKPEVLSPSSKVSTFSIKEFPDFRLQESNRSLEVTRADILGKKMLVNVWATWCVACRQEHDFLNQLSAQGVRIIGLNYRDKLPLVNTWFAELGNPYVANLFDANGVLGQQLPVIGAPETYFVDSQGVIQYKHAGILDQSRWEAGLSQIYEEMQ